MKTLFVPVLSLLLAWSGSAPASELTDRIRAEAQACADALLAGDYAGVVARTHPKIVAEMGGPEAAKATLGELLDGMKAEGMAFESATIAPPGEPKGRDAVVAVLLEQTAILTTPKGRYRQIGHLIAVSGDGGATWSFVDTSSYNAASLRQSFPELDGLIELPAKVPPEKID